MDCSFIMAVQYPSTLLLRTTSSRQSTTSFTTSSIASCRSSSGSHAISHHRGTNRAPRLTVCCSSAESETAMAASPNLRRRDPSRSVNSSSRRSRERMLLTIMTISCKSSPLDMIHDNMLMLSSVDTRPFSHDEFILEEKVTRMRDHLMKWPVTKGSSGERRLVNVASNKSKRRGYLRYMLSRHQPNRRVSFCSTSRCTAGMTCTAAESELIRAATRLAIGTRHVQSRNHALRVVVSRMGVALQTATLRPRRQAGVKGRDGEVSRLSRRSNLRLV